MKDKAPLGMVRQRKMKREVNDQPLDREYERLIGDVMFCFNFSHCLLLILTCISISLSPFPFPLLTLCLTLNISVCNGERKSVINDYSNRFINCQSSQVSQIINKQLMID